MEYKALKDLTKEERSEIVEAKLRGEVEWYNGSDWEVAGDGILVVSSAYRIKPAKKLDIPWEIIKPDYKWAAVCAAGVVAVFTAKPNRGYKSWYFKDSSARWDRLTALSIDTTGISWENSLTQRPE